MAMEFQRIGVIGLGTMGHGIVQTMALAGGQIKAFDTDSMLVENLHQRIAKNLSVMMEENAIAPVDVDEILQRITCCDSEADAIKNAEFVVEAIAEDLQAKQLLFARCESLVGADAILASNTSSFPSSSIASGLRHPERAINTHWFNPPHIIPVVEIIPGERTSDATIERVISFMKALGKHPVRVNQELPGFVLNRLQVALFREMLDLVGRGVISAEDLDVAVRGSLGLRWAAVGPMRVGDFGGWDILSKVYQVLAGEIRSYTQLPEILADMQASGNIGLKAGQGFFEFPTEDQAEIIADKDRKFMAWAKTLREAYQSGE